MPFTLKADKKWDRYTEVTLNIGNLVNTILKYLAKISEKPVG